MVEEEQVAPVLLERVVEVAQLENAFGVVPLVKNRDPSDFGVEDSWEKHREDQGENGPCEMRAEHFVGEANELRVGLE